MDSVANTTEQVGVFPASGGIGGSTVKYLLRQLPPQHLTFIARNSAKLNDAKSRGATVRVADYDENETLEKAFEGIDILFLISYASVEHEHRTERHKTAIDFAIRSGVRYIFYGSLGFAGSGDHQHSVAHVMQPHLDTERYLKECADIHTGFGYTVIREGLYTESFPLYTAFFDLKNPAKEIRIPHNGSGPGISWVKREELGEGTANFITRWIQNQETRVAYLSQTVLLSGSQALTLKESVDILAKVVNQPVRICQCSDDEFADQPQVSPNFVYRGVNYSKAWASSFEGFRKGEAAEVSPLLKELLNREPEDFETTVANMLQRPV